MNVVRQRGELPRIEAEGVMQDWIVIATEDGRRLDGIRYEPVSGEICGAILLNAGTGIPQFFYAAFAAFLASSGFAVITYDYRGVGASAPESLRGYEATKVEWGRYDFSAAFERLEADYPEHLPCVFGHSVGGQLLGLMENADRIGAVMTYGSGFGYWGGMKGTQRALVWTLWYVLVPSLTRVCGYMPASKFGLGEDLPSGVTRDWARWGKREDYFISEIGDEPGFRQIDVPWLALVARDDEVATPENSNSLLACYPEARLEVRWLEPGDFGLKSLGHIGFFSRKCRAAWPQVRDWFARVSHRQGG